MLKGLARVMPLSLMAWHGAAGTLVTTGTGLALRQVEAPPDEMSQLFVMAGVLATYGLSAGLNRLMRLSPETPIENERLRAAIAQHAPGGLSIRVPPAL